MTTPALLSEDAPGPDRVATLDDLIAASASFTTARQAELVRKMMKRTSVGLTISTAMVPLLAIVCLNTVPAPMQHWVYAWFIFSLGGLFLRVRTEVQWRTWHMEATDDDSVLHFIYSHRWAWFWNAVSWGLAPAIFYGNVPTESQVFCWAIVAGSATGANMSLAGCPRVQALFTRSLFAVMLASAFLARSFEALSEPIFSSWFLLLPAAHWIILEMHAKSVLKRELGVLIHQDQLNLERDRAHNAIAEKNRFLASASHDMRQPVQAVRHLAGTMRMATTLEEAQRNLVSLQASAEAVHDLLESLFSLANLNTGAVVFKTERVDIRLLVNELHERYAPVAQAKGLKLRMRGNDTSRFLIQDRIQLTRLISNLIVNAIKFTPKGQVMIWVRDAGGLALEVWDTGIGIPKDQQEDIFREFVKVKDPKDTGTKDGFGLGLAIVQRLGNALNCPVKVVSKVGKGSVFRVALRDGNAEYANRLTGRDQLILKPRDA